MKISSIVQFTMFKKYILHLLNLIHTFFIIKFDYPIILNAQIIKYNTLSNY